MAVIAAAARNALSPRRFRNDAELITDQPPTTSYVPDARLRAARNDGKAPTFGRLASRILHGSRGESSNRDYRWIKSVLEVMASIRFAIHSDVFGGTFGDDRPSGVAALGTKVDKPVSALHYVEV